jgi:hypothetical protein
MFATTGTRESYERGRETARGGKGIDTDVSCKQGTSEERGEMFVLFKDAYP